MNQTAIDPTLPPSNNRIASALFMLLGMTAVYILSAFVRIHLRYKGFNIES